ncbi:hypothetical protein HPP92_021538 [Vanilla planifolia]|uniref:tRNAHis guanylyltransferase catalytic domain-containing protein n=1 Tax=Vanilla planifolia TaxID=51239 RepID=A0A835PVK5_VANPL|nr:hypothetical protein HPP92_021538 [Vanilla planifolia]
MGPHKDLLEMANSKYEYVKKFEVEDKLPPCNWVILRIDGCHFHRFSAVHDFEKPNDVNALMLMNSCAVAMLEHFPDIAFAYGVSDEYSFIWKETSQFYQRRASALGHINNQYNTCFWKLVQSGKSEKEAQELLKGTLAKDKNEMLFTQFGINYDKLPAMFKKGSCVYKDHVEETVKIDEAGNQLKE